MIHALRKRHRYTWVGLAILLPLGFILAFISIPDKQIESINLEIGQVVALPDVVKSKAGTNVNITIRKAPDKSEQQLEIVVMHPLKSPAASVYLSAQPFDQAAGGQLIGQLGPKGVYRFNLDSVQSQYSNFYLLVYDHIKAQTIEQLNL